MNGGLGNIIGNEVLKAYNTPIIFEKMGINDEFCAYNGSYEGMKEKYHITKKDVMKKIVEIYKRKKGIL